MSQGAVTWTPLELIRVTAEYLADHGVPNARLDAELLLAEVLRMDRMGLYLQHERPLVPDELSRYRELVRRRSQRVPLQLLVGRVQLHDLEFETGEGVFIPRPETEVLIEKAMELEFEGGAPSRVLELGCGTGVIGISLLVHWPEASLLAYDVSPAAIELTLRNARRHGVEARLEAVHADAFAEEQAERWRELDLVVSNPPYVAESERADLQPEVRDHDPAEALFSGPEGLDDITRLIDRAAVGLRSGGWLAFEHGADQELPVATLLGDGQWRDRACFRDLADHPRVSVARRV